MVKIVKLDDKVWGEALDRPLIIFENDRLSMGILSLSSGSRLPKDGFSVHRESDEVAYILSGEAEFCTEDDCYVLSEGDLLLNSKGTKHFTLNRSGKPVKIIWFLYHGNVGDGGE